MIRLIGVVLSLGPSLLAQDGRPSPAAGADLPQFRAAFAAVPVELGPVIAIGCASLWLWPQPDADKPAKLGAVVVTTRLGGGTGGPIGSALPQFVELVPEAK